MEKTVSPSRKLGRMLAKNLILLFTTIVVAFVGMFSWFTNDAQADADGIAVNCQAPDGIEIAVVEHGAAAPKDTDYKKGDITLKEKDYQFLSELSLTEITSDGKDFLKPMLIQKSGVANPDLETDWVNAEPNLHYLSFDLYIRCKSKQRVLLDSASKFSTVSQVLTGSNAGNKSNSGNFSKDCVVGASRFSVLSSDSAVKDPILLWIPRPDIELKENNRDFSVVTNTISQESQKQYYYIKNNGKYTKVEKSATVSTKGTNDQFYHLPNDVELLQLNGEADENGYYTSHVVCNMWIDGEDPEARLALVGGKFTIDLKLESTTP